MMGIPMYLVVDTPFNESSGEVNFGGSYISNFISENRTSLRLPTNSCYRDTLKIQISNTYNDDNYVLIGNYIHSMVIAGNFPVILGGDHRTTLHVLRSAFSKDRLAGLIILDAHTDCQGLDMPLSNYNVLGLVRREFPSLKMALIGARDSDVNIIRKQNIFNLIIDATEFATIGLQKTIDLVNRLMEGQLCYLSIDLDVLDPLCFPCVSTHISGGLQPLHLFSLIRELKPSLISADVVEFNVMHSSPLHYLFISDMVYRLLEQS